MQLSPWWLPQSMSGFPFGWGNAPMPTGQLPWSGGSQMSMFPGMGRAMMEQYNIPPMQQGMPAPTPVQTTSFGPAPTDGSAPQPLLAPQPQPRAQPPMAMGNRGLLANTPFDFMTAIRRGFGQLA